MDIRSSNIYRCLNKTQKQAKGWKFEEIIIPNLEDVGRLLS
jgi:hypothetical protein